MMDKVKTFFMLSEEDQKQLKKKYFQVTPNVCFCDDLIVMLKSDGTVLVSGNGKLDARKWTNIIKICSGSRHIVGLKSNGKVVAFGDNTYHQCDVASWKNVQNIFAKDKLTVGITNNDEMLITGSSDTYSDEMNLIEQNALKLSDFIRTTENNIDNLSKRIDDVEALAKMKMTEQMSEEFNNFKQKINNTIQELSKQIDKQSIDTIQLKKYSDICQKQIESLKNVVVDTSAKVDICCIENVDLNDTNEIKSQAKDTCEFEEKVKLYNKQLIKNYIPSEDFFEKLGKRCKLFIDHGNIVKYTSKPLVEKFGLQNQKVFLSYDPYFNVAISLQGKYGFAVSKSGIFTTNNDKILSSSFLEIAFAKEILYKKQGTYCIFGDEKLIVNCYTDVTKPHIKWLIIDIRKMVRADLLEYLANSMPKVTDDKVHSETSEKLSDLPSQQSPSDPNFNQTDYVKQLKRQMYAGRMTNDTPKNLCYGCMKENNGEQICPHCGFDKDYEQTVPYLPLGTKLQNGNYIIGKKISSNSQGAKYIAYSNTMNSPVIISEFMPAGIGGRSKESNNVVVKNGFDGQYNQLHEDFLKYYRNIERLRDLKAITPILDIFSENNTSYVVEETYVSIPFTEYLERRGGDIEWSVARPLFKPLVSAMSSLHETKTGHYAIAPSNLVVTADGKLRLKDFAISDIRKSGGFFEPELIRGCSAPEQYQKNGVLDESTDVYGFTATLFYALTGNMPQSADMRKPEGKLAIPTAVFKRLPRNIVTTLSEGLQVSKSERIQTFEELNTCIDSSFVPPKNIFDTPFTYRANNSEVLLLEYIGNSSEVIIPSTIDEKAVKGLVGTFQNYKDLKSVTIPDSVNFIGERTFYGCRILRDIYIPDSVVSIADDAFSRCDMRLTIHGKKGSYAEKYAKQKWLKFIETD